MSDTKINFYRKLPPVIEEKMENGLLAYETKQGVDVNFQPVILVLFEHESDDEEDAIGVLDAFSSYSCVHIKDLWVDEKYRGQGYGRLLIEALERQCAGKGFDNINTLSCDFQAPGFYKKCGFEVEFVRQNKRNPKLTMTFFIKRFTK